MVFVDGSEEPDGVGLSGVFLDEGELEAFGHKADPLLVQQWKQESGKSKVIHQAELWPALLSMATWWTRLRMRRVILFVDNDGARGALIKGTSTSAPSAKIVSRFWELVAQAECHVWVERVPSLSNVADGPSRGDWAEVKRAGGKVRPAAALRWS